MGLLPPTSRDSHERWEYYKQRRIDVPTFKLRPIHKPDASPFLIHMTGKREILDILTGNGDSYEIVESQGYLRSNVPSQSSGNYNAAVVCFTECPTFAIDFFRYRSRQRWEADQRFGIGFDKTTLAGRGVVPALYLDNNLNRRINAVFHRLDGLPQPLPQLVDTSNSVVDELVQIITQLYPIVTPLGSPNSTWQGFMWEREWRYPRPDGLIFDHSDIEIICCPKEEEDEIRSVLGSVANKVRFIRAWQEYEDVTDYLARQYSIWSARYDHIRSIQQQKNKISQLQELIRQYQMALSSLSAYEDVIQHLHEEVNKTQQARMDIAVQIDQLKNELQDLEQVTREETQEE